MKAQINKIIPAEQKPFFLITKWKKIGGIAGCSWALISLALWSLASGGPTSGANPPVIFMILTLPASIPILVSYYLFEYRVIDISGTLLVCLIPIFGIIIGVLIGHSYEKRKWSE